MYSQNDSDNFAIIDSAVLRASLKPTTKLVYAAIASFYRGESSLIFPSYNRIADIVGVSRNTAIVAVKELVNAGILKKAAQMRADGGFTSNLYTLYPSNLNALGSNLNDTSPSNLNDTSPSNLNAPRIKEKHNKNNLFKINNIRARGAKNAAGEMLRTPESPEQKNKDSTIFEIFKSSKCSGWFELGRINTTYFLRPISSKVFSYVSKEEFDNLREKIAESAESCRALKYGQRNNEKEVILS